MSKNQAEKKGETLYRAHAKINNKTKQVSSDCNYAWPLAKAGIRDRRKNKILKTLANVEEEKMEKPHMSKILYWPNLSFKDIFLLLFFSSSIATNGR